MDRSSPPILSTNVNPIAFGILAEVVATVIDAQQSRAGVGRLLTDMEHMWSRSRREPLGFHDLETLAGPGLEATDRRAMRAAWLLTSVEQLRVVGVHTQLVHRRRPKSTNSDSDTYHSPLIEQLNWTLGGHSEYAGEHLAPYASVAPLDVVGVREGEIWVAHAYHSRAICESAFSDSLVGPLLARSVFPLRTVPPDAVQCLERASELMSESFPGRRVRTWFVLLHPERAEFELHELSEVGSQKLRVELYPEGVHRSSFDVQEKIEQDASSIFALPNRLSDKKFQHVPPCRGGRCLQILSSVARRQSMAEGLQFFTRGDVDTMVRSEYGRVITEDKLRHDLQDRLAGQGLFEPFESKYYLSVKGVARYLYYLTKYTTIRDVTFEFVIDACRAQLARRCERLGY